MPWPRVTCIGRACRPASAGPRRAAPGRPGRCPRRRQAGAVGRRHGEHLADHAREDEVGGAAEDLRADDVEPDADRREQQDADDQARSGRSSPSSRRREPPKSIAFGRLPPAHRAVPTHRAAAPGRPGRRAGRWPVAARSCGLLLGELGQDDLAVGLVVVISSLWVPVPTTRPSSSTTIRSALRIVLTRAGRRSPPSPRRSPGARRGAGRRRWRSRAPRTSRRTGRSPAAHQGPGDREALALAAGDVPAALGDRRLQAVHLRTNSWAWAISSACHSSSSVASGSP